MNEKAVALWLAALRSGKIQQSRLRLGRGDGSRCCLGVACDVAVEAGIIDSYSLLDTQLPPEVVDWLGLEDRSPIYTKENGEESCLVGNNDKDRMTFAQIADIIESKPKGMFKEAVAL